MPDLMGNATLDDVISAINNNTQNMSGGSTTAATALADSAAKNAYYQAQAAGATSNAALEAAKFAWQQKLDEAQQTGMWNGQWNNPQEQWFTGQFGQWYGAGGEPGVGTQTQQAQQQAYNQAQQLSQAYGQYYAPGTTPIAGNLTSAQQQQQFANAQQTAALTGWYTPARDYNVQPGDFTTQDAATQQWYLQYNENDPVKAAAKWAQDAGASVRQFYAANPDFGKVQTMA